MSKATWIVDLKQNPDDPDEVYIELPVQVIEEMGLKPGDELEVAETKDNGEIVLIRK